MPTFSLGFDAAALAPDLPLLQRLALREQPTLQGDALQRAALLQTREAHLLRDKLWQLACEGKIAGCQVRYVADHDAADADVHRLDVEYLTLPAREQPNENPFFEVCP